MTPEIEDTRRTVLAVSAFIAGAAIPVQLITLSFGYAGMVRDVPQEEMIQTAHEFAGLYIPFVYLPALVALAAIAIYSRTGYEGLYRRIVVGLGAGAVGTVALDAVRLSGVVHGWLPSDMPMLFGQMATSSQEFAVYFTAGTLIHFITGTSFELFYTFVWRKRPSYWNAIGWAVAWAMVIELGMMTGPPVAPMASPFGIDHQWPHLFLVTLIAHVLLGIVMGLLAQHFFEPEDRGLVAPIPATRDRRNPTQRQPYRE